MASETEDEKTWDEVLAKMLPAGAPLSDEDQLDYSIAAVEYEGPPLPYDVPKVDPIDLISFRTSSVVSVSVSELSSIPVAVPVGPKLSKFNRFKNGGIAKEPVSNSVAKKTQSKLQNGDGSSYARGGGDEGFSSESSVRDSNSELKPAGNEGKRASIVTFNTPKDSENDEEEEEDDDDDRYSSPQSSPTDAMGSPAAESRKREKGTTSKRGICHRCGKDNRLRGMEFVEKLTESPDEKLNKLKRKLEHLVSKEHDVMVELEYAEQLLMKKPRKEVENWLQEVGRTKTEVQHLEAGVKEKSIFKRLTLGNSIDRCTTQVEQLIQRGVFSGGLTLQVCDSGVPLVTTELVGKEFQKNKKMIWERLMDDNISTVGVYGMGGIGKTTLITHIHDQLLHHPSSTVSWVTVSQNCSTYKLQGGIAKVLGLGPLDEKDERRRAAVLASVLRKKKNFVLILDDIWDYIKLDEVGIPANEIGCKLIITTRSLDVCRMMNCKEIIKVEPLSEKDAWVLFQKHLGHSTTLPSEIEEIAKSLVNEFAGLPLGIILAAGCLRGVDAIFQWNDALEQMKDPRLGQDELEFGKVYQVLKWSFDKLNPTLQQCFLYCALYPEDYEIVREVLFERFIDEKLIREMNTRQAELNRGHTILNKLENSCLLEPGKGNRGNGKYVKMHDVVRHMAINIASKNSPRFLVGVEATDKLEDEELMEDTVRMSLLISDFDTECTPHISPRCPTLSTVLFFGLYSNSIPDCFFTHMNTLTVLDLSGSGIDKLPASVYNLQCLTSLVLRGCYSLRYLSSLKNLKALRRLDLCLSGIIELPEGIDTLTRLRYLNLKCPIKVIHDGILCKLSHLQYLVLNRNCEIIEEIASLRRLETLLAYFRDLNDFNACVNSWKDGGPTDYSLTVGNGVFTDYLGFRNAVYLRDDDASVSRGGKHLLMLPNHINSLRIENIENLDVTSFCDQRAFDLRKLVIVKCGGIKHLLPCSCLSIPAFQSLESLYLQDLHDLSDLVEVERSASSALHAATFSYLKDIRIGLCCNIKRLFTRALLYNLQNLERLFVYCCYEMVEIIGPCDELDAQEASPSTSSTLPNLSHLVLYYLPELKFFCSNIKMDFPSLKDISIYACPKLKRLPPLPTRVEVLVHNDNIRSRMKKKGLNIQ